MNFIINRTMNNRFILSPMFIPYSFTFRLRFRTLRFSFAKKKKKTFHHSRLLYRTKKKTFILFFVQFYLTDRETFLIVFLFTFSIHSDRLWKEKQRLYTPIGKRRKIIGFRMKWMANVRPFHNNENNMKKKEWKKTRRFNVVMNIKRGWEMSYGIIMIFSFHSIMNTSYVIRFSYKYVNH